MRLYVDNAAPEKLKGQCVFFVRCRNDIPINTKNIQVPFSQLGTQISLLEPPSPAEAPSLREGVLTSPAVCPAAL